MVFQEAILKFLYSHILRKPYNAYLRENVFRENVVERVELISPNTQRNCQCQTSGRKPKAALLRGTPQAS